MKHFYAGRNSIAALVAAASCLLMSPEMSLAQRGSPGATAAGRRIDTLNRQGEQYERDRLSRDRPSRDGAAEGDRRSAQALADQVKHDFEDLQAGYNKIVLAMAPGRSLDYGAISEAVAEVKRCAARLKHNLALPRAKDDGGQKGQGPAGAEPVEESLLALRKHIYSFVTNPTFEAPAVLDVEKAGKAGRDLDMILELSERIRKSVRGQKGRPD